MCEVDEATILLGAGEEGLNLAFARARRDKWPPTSLTDWQLEELEIAESYREADERFFAEEAQRAEEAEQAEHEHWLAIERQLARRDNRRNRRRKRN